MASYWSNFGPRSQDFWDGVREGISAYAIWNDGEQLVGCLRRPMREIFAELPPPVEVNDDGKR